MTQKEAPNFRDTCFRNCSNCKHIKKNQGCGCNSAFYCSEHRFFLSGLEHCVCDSWNYENPKAKKETAK